MSNQGKIQEKVNYFLKIKIPGKGWLRNRQLEFLNLLKMIQFRYPFQPIKAQALWLLVYGLIYPFPRIVLGRERTWRICHSLLDIYFPSVVIPLFPPLKSKVILRDLLDFEIYRDIYVCGEYIHETLKGGMNVIDVGAHMGMYTVLAAEKIGKNGKVIAIEPEPENYRQLLRNIKLNNFQNVIPKNIALTDHNGCEKLYISPDSYGHSLFVKNNQLTPIEVPVRTLDKLLEELSLNRVDVIKIDAEGAEIPILKGAEKTLKANPNIKMFIASYHYPSQIKEVCQFLNERGFKTKVSSGNVVMTT